MLNGMLLVSVLKLAYQGCSKGRSYSQLGHFQYINLGIIVITQCSTLKIIPGFNYLLSTIVVRKAIMLLSVVWSRDARLKLFNPPPFNLPPFMSLWGFIQISYICILEMSLISEMHLPILIEKSKPPIP